MRTSGGPPSLPVLGFCLAQKGRRDLLLPRAWIRVELCVGRGGGRIVCGHGMEVLVRVEVLMAVSIM